VRVALGAAAGLSGSAVTIITITNLVKTASSSAVSSAVNLRALLTPHLTLASVAQRLPRLAVKFHYMFAIGKRTAKAAYASTKQKLTSAVASGELTADLRAASALFANATCSDAPAVDRAYRVLQSLASLAPAHIPNVNTATSGVAGGTAASLDSGAIVGIAVAATAVFAIIVAFYFFRKRVLRLTS
jgi:hypothetical protein